MTTPDPSTTGTVLGEREFNALELETMWPAVPADAKPGDDGLINELSVPQRLALPAAFHRPVWDDLGTPHLWHCAVCWGDGWTTQWPCAEAARDGRSVVLDPRGLSAAREEGAAAERERWAETESRYEGLLDLYDTAMHAALREPGNAGDHLRVKAELMAELGASQVYSDRLARLVRDRMLDEESLAAGYGLEDVAGFLQWVENGCAA